jgi:hypothetical protein
MIKLNLYGIDDKYKNIILGYTSSSPFFPICKPPPKSPTKPPCKSRKAFLHDFIQAFGDELEEVQADTTEEVPISADIEPDPPSYLLINAAKGANSTPLPPGDISRVMSKNSKRSVY